MAPWDQWRHGIPSCGRQRQFFQAVNGQKFSLAIELQLFSFVMSYCILVTFISKQKGKRKKAFLFELHIAGGVEISGCFRKQFIISNPEKEKEVFITPSFLYQSTIDLHFQNQPWRTML